MFIGESFTKIPFAKAAQFSSGRALTAIGTLSKGSVIFARAAHIYSIFDSAIANLLCLETLRHGTSIKNYLNIQINGIEPKKHAGKGGESQLFQQTGGNGFANCQERGGQFFVLEDSSFHITMISQKIGENSLLSKFIINPFIRQMHLSYYISSAYFGEALSNKNILVKAVSCVCALATPFFNAISHPVVKLRLPLDQISKNGFETDRTLRGQAIATNQSFKPTDVLGITGSLKQGLNSGWGDRIKRDPAKFLLGVVQLVVAISLTAFAFGYFTACANIIVTQLPFTACIFNASPFTTTLLLNTFHFFTC